MKLEFMLCKEIEGFIFLDRKNKRKKSRVLESFVEFGKELV